MMRDWGIDSGGIVNADSSAPFAIAKRKGAGKGNKNNASGDEEAEG